MIDSLTFSKHGNNALHMGVQVWVSIILKRRGELFIWRSFFWELFPKLYFLTMKFKAANTSTCNWIGEKPPLASSYLKPCEVFFFMQMRGKNCDIHTCSVLLIYYSNFLCFFIFDIHALLEDKKLSLSKDPV